MKCANKYQVGDIKADELCQPDNIIGIWSSPEEGSELLALVYLGEVFEK